MLTENFFFAVHTKVLEARAVENLVMLDDFKYIFEKASEYEQKLAATYAEALLIDKLKEWYKRNRLLYAQTHSIRELRLLAKSYKIKHYNFKTKELLLEEIERAKSNGEVPLNSNYFSTLPANEAVGG